jgi:membrane-bound serine protease (ClpP class)
MVDPVVYVEGIIDSGKVLTFTAEEALQNNYCEGIVNNIGELLGQAGIEDYELAEFKPTALDKVIGFLLSPLIQGLLIMLIVGGLYFELQTPGVGFPLAAAVTAAVLYFAPLYLEGLAEHWEMLIFILGIILLAVEIFAIPGFGVAGISGITLIVAGLTMAMVDNVVFDGENIPLAVNTVLKAFMIVLVSMLVSILGSLWIGKQVFSSPLFPHLALNETQQKEDGFVGVETKYAEFVGKIGEAYTVLRPSGLVKIEGEIIDAKAEYGFIEKGARVKVVRYETGQVYVENVS